MTRKARMKDDLTYEAPCPWCMVRGVSQTEAKSATSAGVGFL